MKFAIALCLMMFVVVLVISKPQHGRGCMYQLGRCLYECPVGTHAYVSSCISPGSSERTCTSPVAKEERGICDESRCDCDEPNVMDYTTGECVKLENCPKNAQKEDTDDF